MSSSRRRRPRLQSSGRARDRGQQRARRLRRQQAALAVDDLAVRVLQALAEPVEVLAACVDARAQLREDLLAGLEVPSEALQAGTRDLHPLLRLADVGTDLLQRALVRIQLPV